MFDPTATNKEILKKRAFNLRWATVANDVIPLTAADPDFQCLPEIHEAIVQYSKERHFSYGPPEGLIEFRSEMANWFQKNRNLNYSTELILPVNSAAFAIYLTCKSILKNGDEAIIFDPVDFLFAKSITEVNATPISYHLPYANSKFDSEKFEQLITPRTKLICLCNPLNPTGKVFTKQELEELGEIAIRHDLIILSDELWSDIVFDPHHHVSIASLSQQISDRTITIYGFSKTFALAGLRLGVIGTSNPELFELICNNSLHNSTINGVIPLAQVAGIAALKHSDRWTKNLVSYLNQNKNFLVNELNKINGFNCQAPQGTYLFWISIQDQSTSSLEVQQKLLNNAKVALVPGLKEWFGPSAEGHLRLCFATQKDILEKAINQIKICL